MANIEKNWEGEYKPSLGQKISEEIRQPKPLKPHINAGVRNIQQHRGKLTTIISKIEQKDASLFRKVVEARRRRDMATARSRAGELAELRKVKRITTNAHLALEKVEIRLAACSDLGDTLATLSPTIRIMNSLAKALGRFMPEAENEIGNMASTLDGLLERGMSDGGLLSTDHSMGTETEDIMEKAAAVAAERIGSKLPSMPSNSEKTHTGQL